MASDIHLSSLIFRKLPPSWHPYIKLTRLDRPIGIWLLLFPGWWSIMLASGGVENMTSLVWKYMGFFALGAVLMRSAGCIINDLWDRRLDAGVERTRTRPLASGEVSVRQAFYFLAGLLFLSLLILLCLPPLAVLLGVFSLLLIILYPKMKKITWWPQLFLGFTFNWGALMGWAAVANHLSFNSLLLYAGGVFWTLGYDTIYAHQDVKDDELIGIKSTARLFKEKSRTYVTIFYALSLFFLLAAKQSTVPGFSSLLILLPALHAAWQMKSWNMDDPASCLRIFKSNQTYGWLIFLMTAL